MKNDFLNSYDYIKDNFKGNEGKKIISDKFQEMFFQSSNFLKKASIRELKSLSPNKEYFAFENENMRSRAVNKKLFDVSDDKIYAFFNCLDSNNFDKFETSELTKICYKIAISFCTAVGIVKKDDQKTPGTFFELLIGQIFTILLGCPPRKQVEVLSLDNLKTKLPTDLIFDLGSNKTKFHVPVKTSTRERVIQVWAHQRVLDGVYGSGRFIGILACLSETKVDQRKLEVVEICLPDQWRIYQSFIAKMERIYYFDLPEKYKALNDGFPPISVREFGEFFKEVHSLIN